MLPWIGNILIVLGLWKMGDKSLIGPMSQVVGEICWIGWAVKESNWPLASLCTVFVFVGLRNLVKWQREK